MKRYILNTVFLFILLFVFAGSACAQDVSAKIDIILASETSSYIDSRLIDVRNQLQKIFRFSSYELYESKNVSLVMGQERAVSLPAGKTLLLKPLYYQENMVVIQAKITDGKRLVVDTQFRVSSGGSFFIGGPKTGSGVIILKVTAL